MGLPCIYGVSKVSKLYIFTTIIFDLRGFFYENFNMLLEGRESKPSSSLKNKEVKATQYTAIRRRAYFAK